MGEAVSVRVSVVIPVYNRAQPLRRALQSLAAQTARDFEVIVVDDGSTEDIAAVVRSIAGVPGLRCLRIDNSGGPARPRNVGIGQARGEWIAFLDSDDWWDPQRMACVLAALDEGVDVLYHPLRVVRAPGLRRGGERRRQIGQAANGPMLVQLLTRGNPIPNSAALVRRRLLQQLGGIDENPLLIEDFDTWLRLAAAGARFRFLPQELGSYWVGEDGISALNPRQIEKYRATVWPHLQRLAPELRTLATRCQHYHLGSMYLKLGRWAHAEARRQLQAAQGLPTLGWRLRRWVLLGRTWL